ncbi:MAG: TonB family protein [Treponema sp.]|nr:TonB family protein [Treponema sp.]
MNEKILRLFIFTGAAALHVLVIFFLVFNYDHYVEEAKIDPGVMRLFDIDELPPVERNMPPPPPPPPSRQESDIPQVEEIAETMIETDIPPEHEVVAAGTLVTPVEVYEYAEEADVYLRAHELTTRPMSASDEAAIIAALQYPRIALNSGIEGVVYLEIFVDRTGVIQNVVITREVPPGRGFGEAAVRAFSGKVVTPATANGFAVSSRINYPVRFRIRQ